MQIIDSWAFCLRSQAVGQKDRFMSGLNIASTIGSLNTVRNLSAMHRSIRKTASRLASGKRITRAADDSAGLVVSEQMRAQVASLTQQIVNLDNVIKRNKTADSHLVEMEDHLIEMREIATAAASTGGIEQGQVEAYEDELDRSAEALDKMADDTMLGDSALLDGSENSVAEIQRLGHFDLSDVEKVKEAVTRIDERIKDIQKVHAGLGAAISREIESMRESLAVAHRNLVETESDIRDSGMALEQSGFVSRLVRSDLGSSLLAQGNLVSQSVFGLVTDP